MAEKSSELRNDSIDKLDPVSTSAGAGRDEFLEKYSEDLSDTERRELDANTGDAPEETEQIKAKIEATRSQMGETIDAIQERLSIANIQEQVSETVSSAIESAKDTAYDATIGKAVNFMKNVGDGVTHSSTFRTVRNNPLPFALIGLGAGLLAYQSYNGRGISGRYGNGRDARRLNSGAGINAAERSTFGSTRESFAGAASDAYEGISDKASAAVGTVGSAASSAVGGITSAAGTAYDSVTGAVSTAYTGAEDFAHRAYDRAGEFGTMAHDKYDQVLEENPLALGALAVAVGAAVGFAIPSTNYEGKLMGDARENLVQRAQDAAGTFVDKAKQVASEAGETIKHEAQALSK